MTHWGIKPEAGINWENFVEMKKFVALFGAKKPFTQTAYPRLFQHLLSMSHHGIRFGFGVIGFEHDGDVEEAFRSLMVHLEPSDELIVFEVSSARWHLTSLKKGDRMQEFLEG